MLILDLILLLVAAILFFLAGVGVASRFNLLAFGLFAWVLVTLIHVVSRLA